MYVKLAELRFNLFRRGIHALQVETFSVSVKD